jgi:catechol 2,3-dioxygenase-like lactoylglutathione lyase family enzyme
MEPRIHVITLAVRDLDRALAFYRDGLGLESAGVVGTEFTGDDHSPAGAIALFHLDGGLILSLYPRTELAKDADVPFAPPKSGEFSIGHLVGAREDVDALLERAEAAGAPPPMGDLLRLLPRPRWAPLGDHLESPVVHTASHDSIRVGSRSAARLVVDRIRRCARTPAARKVD